MSRARRLALAAIPAAVLLAAGCGGGGKSSGTAPRATPATPPNPAEAQPTRRGPAHPWLIAALGDSITAGAPLWDPDPAVRRQHPEQLNPQSQYEYWARLALGRNVHFRNCGVSGQTTAEIAARLDYCVSDAQALIVEGGVNDIAQGIPIGAAARNLEAMVRRGRRLRLRVAIAELLPWNRGYPSGAGPIRRLNRRIHAIARRQGAEVLPWYRALEDPRRPGRMPESLTIDDIHPNVIGYRRLGRVVASSRVGGP